MQRLFFIVMFVILLFSCGKNRYENHSDNKVNILLKKEKLAMEIVPFEKVTYDNTFSSEITKIKRYNYNGDNLLILNSNKLSAEDFAIVTLLTSLDMAGQENWNFLGHNVNAKDFVIHPSGLISAIILDDKINQGELGSAFLIKIDNNGNLLLTKKLPMKGVFLYEQNVKIIADGEDVILLTFSGPLEGDYLSKLNKDFDEIWETQIPYSKNDFISDSHIMVDEFIYVFSPSKSNGSKTSYRKYTKDGYLIRIEKDYDFSVTWRNKFGQDSDFFYITTVHNGKISMKSLFKNDLKLKWDNELSFDDKNISINTMFIDESYIAIGGTIGFTQAPIGGSVLSYSDGILFFVNKNLGSLSKVNNNPLIMKSKRTTNILSIEKIKENEYIIGGVDDKWITHDGDNDKSQKYSRGFTLNVAIK